ncbi:MAG: hypothetical protein ACRDDA_01705, partial [Aeromonas sp.]
HVNTPPPHQGIQIGMGLFIDAVNSVIDWFRESHKLASAFEQYPIDPGALELLKGNGRAIISSWDPLGAIRI